MPPRKSATTRKPPPSSPSGAKAPSPQPTPKDKKTPGKRPAKVSRKETAPAASAPHPESQTAASAPHPELQTEPPEGGSSDTTTDVPAASGYVVYLRQHVPYSHLMHPCTIVDGLPYLVMQSMIVLERHHDDLILKSGFIYSTNHGPVYMQAIGYVGGHHVRRSRR